MTITKCYSELITLPTFEERFEYLRLDGRVGQETFGYDRYLNQEFYKKDPKWLKARNDAIIRDNGCDLSIPGRDILVKILVHHIEPITTEDILNRNSKLYDLENLVCTMKLTHDAIHYGDGSRLLTDPVERSRNDTCPWRR